jgi:tripartite-type tricarboxylate transporter receptor subunit TctC
VVVDNRAGANGNVGADHVAKSAPDGYTLLLSDVGALAINPSVYPNIPYDVVKDFSPVGMVSYSPHAFGVHPSVPVNNVKELIDYAKANPGKLNFAISGTGGAPHLAGIAFAQRTGIKWAYIPYKGGSQAVADVASGQANVIMNGMLATYPTMKSGRIRALAISSAQRVSSAPEVPTIAETLPGFETGSYQGLLAPAGTPRDVVSKLNAEVAKILATPEIATEKIRWAQVIKESGIKFD